MLESLRASGRKLFLATNSLWDYTHVVMNFLLSGRTGHDKNFDWLEYFDVVITGPFPCRPPSYHPNNTPCCDRNVAFKVDRCIYARGRL